MGIVRHTVESWCRGDVEAALSYSDANNFEVVNETGAHGLTGVYHGHEGFLDLIRRVEEIFDEYRTEPLEYSDLGSQVLVRFREVGRGKLSGMEIDRPLWCLYTLEGDMIVRLENYGDREQAMWAAGLGD